MQNMTPTQQLGLEVFRAAKDRVAETAARPFTYVCAAAHDTFNAARTAIPGAVRAPLRLIRPRPDPVKPYKCSAPRHAGTASFFCQGIMRSRRRTARYEGETLVEMHCDNPDCGRTAYSAPAESS